MAGRIEAEAQLRAVTADFEQAAQRAALGEFTASIGHEIRQPLSAILTNAQTTQRWLTRETPNLEKANQLLTRVAASARRASDVIDRVQHAAGNRAPVQAPLDLNEVVRESLLFVRQ
jgi:C4-dicarboxylate-specific signal transduction histidine kinase